MKHVQDRRHPRKLVNGKLKRFPCCGTRTGWHCCCCKTWRQSEFKEYGLGVVLYFKLLKFLICLFFFLSLAALPSMLFFYYGSEKD